MYTCGNILRCGAVGVLGVAWLGCPTASTGLEDAGSVADAGASPAPVVSSVEQVTRYLTGRFDSSEQARLNPSYYAVQLLACEVRLPELGEHVLYVEQSIMPSTDAPYRQRVYSISGDEDVVISTIYEADEPARLLGTCSLAVADRASLFEEVTLTAMSGCDVHLAPTEDGYRGSTIEDACRNDFQGATYATSEVTVTPSQVISWDRGYDEAGVQVWGAEQGPYVFDRKEE